MPSIVKPNNFGDSVNMEKCDSRVLGVLLEEEENSGASSLEDGEGYDEVDAGLCNRSELRRKNLEKPYIEKQLAKNEKRKKKRSESVPNVPVRELKIITPGVGEGKKQRSHSEPAIQTTWFVTEDGLHSKEEEVEMERAGSNVFLQSGGSDKDTENEDSLSNSSSVDPVKFDISLEDNASNTTDVDL